MRVLRGNPGPGSLTRRPSSTSCVTARCIPHSPGLTHLDALVHIPIDGHVYPGRALTEAVTPAGIRHGSTTAFADGVLTGGVLLDLAPGDRLPPAHPVTGADLDAAEQRSGARLEPGDALVVRGGWTFSRDATTPMPGMTVDAVALDAATRRLRLRRRHRRRPPTSRP